MTKHNILILSAGRRVELVKCFQNAAKRLGIRSDVVAGDNSVTAPALYFANQRVVLPKIEEPNYIDEIIEVCKNKDVKLIIPTIDTDLLLLSQEGGRIESESGAKVLISSPEVVAICRDKICTHKFLETHGFKTPKIYSEFELHSGVHHFPLFIKPKSGSSGIDAYKVENYDELIAFMALIRDPMVQEFIEGTEFSVDVFLDFDGSLITVVPRMRMATRGGEISKGKILKDQLIIDTIKRLVKKLKFIGHITVQLIKTDNEIVFIEINPRFGGGAPMSIFSGADSCENLYRLLMGEKLKYNEKYRDNIMFLRFDNSICLDTDMKIAQW